MKYIVPLIIGEGGCRLSLEEQEIEALLDSMHRLFCEHMLEYGVEPEAFLLGPRDWLMFKIAFEYRVGKFRGPGPQQDPKFNGLPVRVKMSPGLELEIDPERASWVLGRQMSSNSKK